MAGENEDPDPRQPTEIEQRSGPAFDRMVGNTVNAGVTAWVTTAAGSPEAGALIGGFAGPLAEELSYAARRIAGIRTRQAGAMISSAAGVAGMDPGELVDRLLSDPRSMQLLVAGLEAAASATSNAKIALVADLIATGALAGDMAVVDDQLLAVNAVRELEIPHFRLLVVLKEPSPVWWGTAEDTRNRKFDWPLTRVVERDPGLRNAMPSITAKLRGLGIAREAGRTDQWGETWSLTTFGFTCVEAISDPLDFSSP